MNKSIILCLAIVIITSCGNTNNRSDAAKNNDHIVYEETITIENRTTDWEYYGEVNALVFQEFDSFVCIGDATKYENISEKFYELEDIGGYLLKPHTSSVILFYRYFDGEKQYRIKNSKYRYFSLNPHTYIEYVIDNNNSPSMRKRDVSNYSHFTESDGDFYFIKMN